MLDFQFYHTWPQITETAESEPADKGTTASASLVRGPLSRCGRCFKSQRPVSGWLLAELSLICLASLFVYLFGCLFIPLDN